MRWCERDGALGGVLASRIWSLGGGGWARSNERVRRFDGVFFILILDVFFLFFIPALPRDFRKNHILEFYYVKVDLELNRFVCS
jgi:hypothetical protein